MPTVKLFVGVSIKKGNPIITSEDGVNVERYRALRKIAEQYDCTITLSQTRYSVERIKRKSHAYPADLSFARVAGQILKDVEKL